MSVLSFVRPKFLNTALDRVTRPVVRNIVLVSLLGATSACGQIGPLYLPDATPEEAPTEIPQSAEEASETENE